MQRRVKLLRQTSYAREVLETGALVFVDDDTADRWIRDKVATEAGPADQLWTTCPRCQAGFQIPAVPKPTERWVQCKNVHCSFGWMR